MAGPDARRRRAQREERPVGRASRVAAPAAHPRGFSRRVRLALIGLLAVGLLVGRAAAPPEPRPQAGVYTGLGFDTCEAPSLAALQAWIASPYRALGIYIGGANRACANTALTSAWVASAQSLGWALVPLYVGEQAPCASGGLVRLNAAQAGAEGAAEATDATASAQALGLPGGSPIYFDMEGYALDNPACTQPVQTFLSSWVSTLHSQGYLAGVYGSAASTMRDLQALATTSATPDDIWIGDWNGQTSVFGDPYVSDSLSNHQRIHQFAGGHTESYGGVTLDIDSDILDAAVVTAGAASAPVTPTPAPDPGQPPATPAPGGVSLSAAGSVSSPDGAASVSWAAGTFAHPVVVTLAPSLPAQPVAGFGSGGYGVTLQVTQTGSSAATTSFTLPLRSTCRRSRARWPRSARRTARPGRRWRRSSGTSCPRGRAPATPASRTGRS